MATRSERLSGVAATAETAGEGLRIDLDAGSIVIRPEPQEVYTEIAMLQGFADSAWLCWRFGDEPFEYLV